MTQPDETAGEPIEVSVVGSLDGSVIPREAPLTDLRIDVPHVARMYDYYLDGKDNFAADRAAVAGVEKAMPEVRQLARENRAFLRRAVRHMVAEGIRQFIDIGAGLPTAGNTHEIAQKAAPDSRIVYVDNDPIVLAHGQALLAENGNTTVLQADMRQPADLIDSGAVRSLIDFNQPVGVLLIAMTHFLTAEEREPIMGTLRDSLSPGSLLALTHVTGDGHSDTAVTGVERVYSTTPTPIYFRTHAEVSRFFNGYTLIEPGLVTVDAWRPDGADPAPAATRWLYGGVGRRR
ncbi:SAM-dependent methyltransferase [Pseudofrankia sp. DC12]|uniref:SAM-dependent methyltransferase n=1 Tax=Pseudofrankia sp. DC12 TaxID=683315 RepID=UPI0009FC1080|nr:SAM-dependent methyltransferase [Pseudofrankia sp. DC12]